MKNEQHSMDEWLRQKLGQHSPTYQDAYWVEAQAYMAGQKRKNRFGGWFSWVLGIGTAALLSISTQSTPHQLASYEPRAVEPVSTERLVTTVSPELDQPRLETTPTQRTGGTHAASRSTIRVEAPPAVQPAVATTPASNLPVSSTRSTASEVTSTGNRSTNRTSTPILAATPQTTETTVSVSVPATGSVGLPSPNPITADEPLTEPEITPSAALSTEAAEMRLWEREQPLNLLRMEPETAPAPTLITGNKPPSFKPWKPYWSVGLMAGAMTAPEQTSDDNTWRTSRQWQYMGGIQGAFHPTANLSIRAGVQINQFQTELTENRLQTTTSTFTEFQDDSYWDYFERTIWEFPSFGQGVTFEMPTSRQITDSVWVEQLTPIQRTRVDSSFTPSSRTISVRYVEIPVFVQYSIPIQRFSIGIAAGAQFRLLSGQNELLTSPEQRSIEAFRSFSVSWTVQPVIGYMIRPSWQVTVYPTWQRSLQSRFTDDTGLATPRSQYGVQFGIWKRF